jgi:hypothetical protein
MCFNKTEPLCVRPHRLLCLYCALEQPAAVPAPEAVARLAETVRRDPGVPLALRCPSHDSFGYQSPEPEPEDAAGACFMQKQDMEILFRMDLAPGTVLPARIAVARARKAVTSVSAICGYGVATSPAWEGCPLAGTGLYERARETMLDKIFPPRETEEMERDKTTSLAAMNTAGAIRTRPHILLCAVAQYGRGVRPPFKDDNLPELVQKIIRQPDTPIELVGGADGMMCAPCGARCTVRGTCMGPGFVHSGGLFNELKDLRILQILGLTFGDVVPGRELFRRIFERMPTTVNTCALERSAPELSVWWDPCPCGGYEKGRGELMREMGLTDRAGTACAEDSPRCRTLPACDQIG